MPTSTVPVRYVGPFDAVDVYPPDGVVAGASYHVEHGATLDATPNLAASLLLQPENWSPADAAGEQLILDLLALNQPPEAEDDPDASEPAPEPAAPARTRSRKSTTTEAE